MPRNINIQRIPTRDCVLPGCEEKGKPELLGVFGVQFVELFFEAMLLLEGTGGFFDAFLVFTHLMLYILDHFGVLKPAFDAVKTFGVYAVVHLYEAVFDVGGAALFDAAFLPKQKHRKKNGTDNGAAYGQIPLPRLFGYVVDGLAYRWFCGAL